MYHLRQTENNEHGLAAIRLIDNNGNILAESAPCLDAHQYPQYDNVEELMRAELEKLLPLIPLDVKFVLEGFGLYNPGIQTIDAYSGMCVVYYYRRSA